MPDINFRLTATDEATPVIDRLRRKMDGMNRGGSSSSSSGSASRSGGSSGNAGMGGILGSGKIGGMAGLTIIAQAALQALQKIWTVLNQASPYLRAVSEQFKTAMNIYLRPLGDSLARVLAPQSEYAIEMADARAKVLEDLDKQFGFVGVALGTFGFGLYDVYTALFQFSAGVMDGLSQILMWPIDKLGDMIGVDLPGSLNELLENLTGIKGGFSGVKKWLEGLADPAIKEKIWKGITDAFQGAWDKLSGFGSWLYNSIKSALSGIGKEAYNALHNAIASLLNSISNIELPLVGKPFKKLFGTIPMLAAGGIVTKPTLAMIGEAGPEAVVPLGKGGFGMGQGITIQINAPVYGVHDLESAIDNAIRRSQMGYAGYR